MRLIDADELIEQILQVGAIPAYIKLIDNAPTVEIPVARWDCYCEGQKVGYEKALSERPQGKWIEVDDTEINGYCSNCGWQSKLYEEDILGMPFCPNCGAKMEVQND